MRRILFIALAVFVISAQAAGSSGAASGTGSSGGSTPAEYTAWQASIHPAGAPVKPGFSLKNPSTVVVYK